MSVTVLRRLPSRLLRGVVSDRDGAGEVISGAHAAASGRLSRGSRVSLRPRSRITAALAVLVASGGAVAMLPAAASGSAVGCTASGFGIKGVSSAYTCIDVESTPMRGGLWVSSVRLSWIGAGTVCNWRMEFRWFNAYGRRYLTNSSPLHESCAHGSAVWERDFGRDVYNYTYGWYYTGRRMRVGQVCGYVIENGRIRHGVPCESIEN
jgi:hypothetical protein